ncbi:hypothetical protein G4B88_012770 [Cannabis sativa]|uniref:Uncharacterized protein n=1 Tax=Cannabis sativa TaxID=3483 RepID=A0A7J6GAE2_CANSA|nr:hypothetical protein G4B88_012770 [Cannabis sativa]
MMSGLSLRAATVRPHPNYLLRQFLLHSPFSSSISFSPYLQQLTQPPPFGWLSMSYPEDAVMSKYCCGAPSFPSEQ